MICSFKPQHIHFLISLWLIRKNSVIPQEKKKKKGIAMQDNKL